MAAKLLHSLTDDNPDLQKQIGCMTGIFQMLDRQHMLTRLPPPGNPHIRNDTLERESNGSHPKSLLPDKYSHKNVQELPRYSIESSRPSSSSSSPFSSLDCNKPTQSQFEPGSFSRVLFPNTPSTSSQNALPQYSRQTVDLRDLVKESIYRDNHGTSIYRNSSRLLAKIGDGEMGLDKKKSTPADIKESLKILAKLQEAPRCNNEPRALLRSSSYNSKDGPSFPISKDAPRFSYDGSNPALKLKDLPRLSLDSRESSMRNLCADSNSNFVSKSMQKHARPPSVVAKLMGLDTLPDSVSSGDNKTSSTRINLDESSYEQTDKIKPVQMSNPSKNSWKEPSSPRWRNSDGSMKPMARLPIEPAPWKQNEGSRNSQRSAPRTARALTNDTPTVFPSVYSEIEKRLGDLEFTQSGKDLRALKQILEAMQAKGLLETPIEGQGSNFDGHEEKVSSSARLVDIQKLRAGQNNESPIVIMKPARLADKSGSAISVNGFSSSQAKLRGGESVDSRKVSHIGRASRNPVLKSSQRENAPSLVNTKNNTTSRITQNKGKEGSAGLGKISGSVSPKPQQKKLEMERRSRPPTPPDSSKSRRQSNKPQVESNSTSERRRTKHICPQKSEEQLSEVSVESRNSNSPENEDSVESNESTPCGAGNVEILSLPSSSSKNAQFIPSGIVEKNSIPMLSEEEGAEIIYVPPEYSSPVSVLDNAVYTRDSPSPIKYSGKSIKVDEPPMVNERHSNAVEDSSPESSTFDYDRKKLQNVDNLVQKLRRINSSHDEARTDYIASLCENTNPDHRYISEISLASGLLLRDLTDFQFHPSGHPINPELFLVLEQTKASSSSKQERTHKITTQSTSSEKLHRRQIFDVVNEILATKLGSTGSEPEPWWRQVKVANKVLNAQNLLKELCSEIDELQAKYPKCGSDEEYGWETIFCQDPLLRSEKWIHFSAEISGAVLDIERLIFKDLVDEIVRGEAVTKPGSLKVSAK